MLSRIKAAGNDKNYYCYPNLSFTFPLNPGVSDGKASACSAGDLGSIPGWGRSPGEGNGYPLQYSYLEKSMDRGTGWATVHGVGKESDVT